MKYHLVHGYGFSRLSPTYEQGYKLGYNMTNRKYKYGELYILEWKRGKEAIYHIEILPKNLNFKKITKIMNFTVFT